MACTWLLPLGRQPPQTRATQVCDACISYFSDGFPLDKAISYYVGGELLEIGVSPVFPLLSSINCFFAPQELRKPFLLNDLYVQRDLLDRRRV